PALRRGHPLRRDRGDRGRARAARVAGAPGGGILMRGVLMRGVLMRGALTARRPAGPWSVGVMPGGLHDPWGVAQHTVVTGGRSRRSSPPTAWRRHWSLPM